MHYKSLLVHVDSDPRSAVRLRLAVELAERFDARITGLFVALAPTFSDPVADVSQASLYEVLLAERRRAAKAARETFERETAGFDPQRLEWREHVGMPIHTTCQHARYHDLVVLGQANPDIQIDGLPASFPEDVVCASCRPALIVPYRGEFSRIGRRILVGWNTSNEATRAITDALPLLQGAERTTVLTADPENSGDDHGQQPGADIALYLARHGAKVEVRTQKSSGRDAGEVLLDVANIAEDDLIVMGLYGHSRMREQILGGASRTVLRHMTLPLLVSH
ncbi:universal stress protein [Chitinimonas lacunae]|uniref:Universal stress protein n=1 Tax=Chitinimonas lacunae TaxID=1963018 RepID=A0ABV8MRI8_9NEIS